MRQERRDALPHRVDAVVGLESNRRSQGRISWLPEAPRSWRPRRDGWNAVWECRMGHQVGLQALRIHRRIGRSIRHQLRHQGIEGGVHDGP